MVHLWLLTLYSQAEAGVACKQDAVVPGYPQPTRVSRGEHFLTQFFNGNFEVDMDLRREVEEVEAVISQTI